MLSLRAITKDFPGVRALDRVDFELRAGEIHALLGENGAGKSTLIKVLTGVFRPDAGEMHLSGRPLAPHSPQHAQSLGISTVYQEINLVPQLSVAENLFLGRQPRRWYGLDWRRMNVRAAESLARLDLRIDVTQPLSSYSVAIQQMVALARALDIDARVLILDEPTSSLDAREVEQLFAVMRRLRAQKLGIIFITHFLDQVYQASDRITVLRNGRLVGTWPAAELSRLELVTRMIGHERAGHGPVAAPESRDRTVPSAAGGPPLLRAKGVGRRGAVAPLDLEIRPGEALGLAGLLGSGRTETARLLFGLDRADSGRVEVAGRLLPRGAPRAAIAAGLGYCPEDRKTDGIIPNLSVRENIILALQAARGWLRRLGHGTQETLAQQYVRALNIATPDLDKPTSQLSGGNQQKVILARWLAAHRRLLILDEPTRGIDVGAKAEIEGLVGELCRDGLAVLFISSELDEVVRNCRRVIVLRDRVKVGELAGADVDVAPILERIAGTQSHG